ncbi:MAG: cytidylate kinase-like family protein [Clostridiales bacterium]|nr:cytidylate kinase-like family protein [Clostridiales bacterium]
MAEKYVLTFARQFGSGGHEVAKTTAEILGIPFYDKELIAIAAKDSGLSEHLFDGLDEKPTNSFLYSLVMGVQSGASTYCRYGDVTGSDNIFRIQAQVIRQIADKGPCVIVGRCADYILREYENLVSVFVHADMEQRTARIMKRYNLKEKNAEDYINKTDKRRNSFYNFYTNRIWGSVENYNLAIDTAQVGIKNAAEIIADYVKKLT